ncbi:hypothetical protein NC653_020068 [Populus alba x Populus x berolinensis]|uniref:Uncharacterized protein n=1 Tax=Populus alba x Populus x berolinensis TaxID=444605 RepID=A0AAD6MK03_9ROSI|nr:hypothetical protein NC653_020068 [Populus alba x Populus x berolinensis]
MKGTVELVENKKEDHYFHLLDLDGGKAKEMRHKFVLFLKQYQLNLKQDLVRFVLFDSDKASPFCSVPIFCMLEAIVGFYPVTILVDVESGFPLIERQVYGLHVSPSKCRKQKKELEAQTPIVINSR